MGKKRKNIPTLQDLLDRPICYYCEKDFEDNKYLVDHMKAKHFRCENCGRRLHTIGGLSVHMSQVHKEKLEKVSNAVEGRDDPNVEIFGMLGWPPDLLENHKARISNEYLKREAEHRKQTGNPPPGTQTAPNPQKNESIEDTKKRFAAFKAKKLAEKAAQEAAANGEAVARDASPVPISAEEAARFNVRQEDASAPIRQAPESPNLPAGGSGSVRGYDVNPITQEVINQEVTADAYDAKPAFPLPSHTPPPSALPLQYPTSSMSTMSMYPTSSMSFAPMSMSSRGPQPSRPGLGYQLPNSSYTGPPPFNTGMSGSPPPPQLPDEGSIPLPPTLPRQNSLPSASGLPQRPAFDSPNVSKEDMAKMHGGPALPSMPPNYYSNNGQMPPGSYGTYAQPFSTPPAAHATNNPPYGTSYQPIGPPGPQYGTPHSVNGMPSGPWYPQNPGEPGPHPSSSYIGDQVDDLIQEVTGEKPKSSSAPENQEPEPMPEPVPVPKLPISREFEIVQGRGSFFNDDKIFHEEDPELERKVQALVDKFQALA